MNTRLGLESFILRITGYIASSKKEWMMSLPWNDYHRLLSNVWSNALLNQEFSENDLNYLINTFQFNFGNYNSINIHVIVWNRFRETRTASIFLCEMILQLSLLNIRWIYKLSGFIKLFEVYCLRWNRLWLVSLSNLLTIWASSSFWKHIHKGLWAW